MRSYNEYVDSRRFTNRPIRGRHRTHDFRFQNGPYSRSPGQHSSYYPSFGPGPQRVNAHHPGKFSQDFRFNTFARNTRYSDHPHRHNTHTNNFDLRERINSPQIQPPMIDRASLGIIQTDSINTFIEKWTYNEPVVIQREPDGELFRNSKRKVNETNNAPNSKRSKFYNSKANFQSPSTIDMDRISSTNSPNNSSTTNFNVTNAAENENRQPSYEDCLAMLSKQIQEYSNFCLSEDNITINTKRNYCNMLSQLVHHVHRDASFRLFGSSINGFVMPSSDLDITLLTNLKLFPIVLLNTILTPIKRNKNFVDCELISAKVPIIKFYDVINKFDVDISINNHSGIKNSFLLKAYCNLDPRVRPLVVVIKEWAKNADVCNSRNGKLSSYAISLMVIFFLQLRVAPPILPSIQKRFNSKFIGGADVHCLQNTDLSRICDEWKSKNDLNLAQLLMDFFEFYSKFSYRQSLISVRDGKILHPPAFQKFRGYKGFINIEDPYTLDNVAQTVYCLDSYSSIIASLRAKYNTLIDEVPDLDGFLERDANYSQ